MLPQSTPMTQRLIFLFVAILTFSLISLVSLKYTSGDFDVYYKASQNYLAKAPVYVAHGGIEEFKYSPLFAFCFSPLTLVKKVQALYVWTVFKIVLFYFIFYLLYQLKQISFNQPKDLLIIVCLFALTGRYLFIDFRLGQVNTLLCFLMVLTMYLEINQKYFWASVVLAFSLMIKFFPLLFVLYFLLRRRFKLLAYTFLMVVLFLFLPSIYSGFSLNLKYLHEWLVLLKSTPAILLYSVRNNSLLSFFSWFFIARHEPYFIFDYNLIRKGLTPQVYWAWGISCFVFFISFFHDTFFVKDKDPKISYLDYSCLFVCGLLFNPLSYLNALTFLIVPDFFILRYLFYSQVSKKYVYLCGSLVFFSFIFTLFDNRVFFKDIYQYYIRLELKPLMWVIVFVYLNLWLLKSANGILKKEIYANPK